MGLLFSKGPEGGESSHTMQLEGSQGETGGLAPSDYRITAHAPCQLPATDWRAARPQGIWSGLWGLLSDFCNTHTHSVPPFIHDASSKSSTCGSFKLCQTLRRKPRKTFPKQYKISYVSSHSREFFTSKQSERYNGLH